MHGARGTAAMLLLALSAVAFALPATRLVRAQTTAPSDQISAARPADDSWLSDAQGRQYRIEPLPRAQATKIDDGRVRTIWGVVADFAREDADFFYLKLYRVAAEAPAPPAPARPPEALEPLPETVPRLRFEPLGTGLPDAGQWREGLAVADVTGDGQSDIIAGPARKTLRAPTVFSRRGTTWTRADIAFPPRPYDYGSMAVAAQTAGRPALLALGVHLRGLIALELDASTGFRDASEGLPFVATAADAVFSSRALAIADCNGDGRSDIVTLGEGPRFGARGIDARAAVGLVSFTRNADGGWTRVSETSALPLYGTRLATGDVDGDGRVDVAIASGQFADGQVVLRGDGRCGWVPEPLPALHPRSFVTAVALSDVDGDGRSEAIIGVTRFEDARPRGHLDIYRRDDKGRWNRTPLARLDGRQRFDAIDTGDIDGDGRIDIVALGPDGEAIVFLGDAGGRFVREAATIAAPGGCMGAALVVRDLDGDRRADLVMSYAQERTTSAPGACPGEGALTAWRVVAPPPAPR